MNFGSPSNLNLLWLIPVLAWTVFWLFRRRLARVRAIFANGALARLAPGMRIGRRAARLALWLLAIASFTFALARPQWGFRWEQTTSRGLDILVLLDTSRSMLAADFKPSRLQQAKWGLRDFARGLRGDRIGLIPFAGSAYLMCPLTVDYTAFLMSLDEANVGIVPRGGTAIAAGLRVAVETFDNQAVSDRVIVLVTDGEDHEGKIENWLPELKDKKIRVYTVGIGSQEGEPLPAPDGGSGFQKDREGNVVLSALREDLLRMLALETGGAYLRAAPGDLGLDHLITEHLASLNRAESESRLSKIWEERAGWFIGFGLLILVVESGLREQRGRVEE